MGKSAAVARETTDIHKYVGQQIRELRGTMSPSSFAGKCGITPALLPRLEAGQPTCLARLHTLADRNGVEVEYFFPDAEIPDDYPDH